MKRKYQLNGKLYTLAELSRISAVSQNALRNRLNRGMPVDKAVSRKATRVHTLYDFEGRKVQLGELVRISGLNANTIKGRIYNYGMTPEEAVKKPLLQSKRNPKLYNLNGKDYTFAQLLKLWPWSASALKNRIFTQGMTAQEAFDMPLYGRR